MTSYNVLMIVIVLGLGLCCESFRAELVRWRREEAAEQRRVSRQRDLYARELPDPGSAMMPEVDHTETAVKPSASTPEGALRAESPEAAYATISRRLACRSPYELISPPEPVGRFIGRVLLALF
jgi:hypothetical protein